MRSNKKYGAGVALAATAGALALVAVSATGASADGEFTNTAASADTISSTVRKTVAVTANADGKVSNSIMITQVSSNGKGQTTVNVPVGADSARNLDSFGGTVVKDGNAVFDMNLNGSQESRVMTTTDPGPIDITAEASLDGQPIEPDQVVNKTGVLKVKYTVVNKEKQVIEVPVRGSDGNTTMEEQEVDAPIGGSVAITLPQGFNEISAPGANIGGNGQGASNLSYSLVMFKPLGNPVSTIEYESRITNGTMPEAVFTMVPIVPMENSTIQTAHSSFGTGVTTGETIADAGKQIGDGAGQLGAGVAKAADGASQLAAGLNGTAIPGANKLADGSAELASKLGAGAKSAPALVEGADDLNDAAKAIAAGVTGKKGDPESGLVPALSALSKAFVSPKPPADGIPKLLASVPLLELGAAGIEGSQSDALGGVALLGGLCPVGVYATVGGLIGAGATVANPPASPTAAATWDIHGLSSVPGAYFPPSNVNPFAAVPADTTCVSTKSTPPTTAKPYGGGLDGFIKTSNALAEGVSAFAPGTEAALTTLQASIDKLYAGVTFKATEAQIKAGEPKPGLQQALNLLADGTDKLAGKAPALVEGMQAAAAGAQQLADGNAKLATGLVPAADGAQQIADGLPAAVEGAGKLADGGKELASKGNEAAASFGNQVNQIDAVQQLGVKGVGIPHGKATGENVTTTGAYQLTLAAAKTPEENNGLRFGLAAVALLAAAGIGTAVARKKSAS